MPRGLSSSHCSLQRNGTVAGRLATEAQALWQMQNSTVQTQEALVVSPCLTGILCHCGGGNMAFAAVSPLCSAGETGRKHPFPLSIGTTPPGTIFSSKKYAVPYGSCYPASQK